MTQAEAGAEDTVFVDGQPLPKHLRAWGRAGSPDGRLDLVFDILLDYAGQRIAARYYRAFDLDIVAKWGNEWRITGDEIDEWLMEKKLS